MRSLALKLVVAFLLVSLTGAALAAVLARQTTNQAFSSYLLEQLQTTFITSVTDYYQENGTLDNINTYLQTVEGISNSAGLPVGSPGGPQPDRPQGGAQVGRQGGPPGQTPRLFLLADPQGAVLVTAGQFQLGEHLTASELSASTPVEASGKLIGRVFNVANTPQIDPREQRYIDRTDQALTYSAIAGALIALLLGLVFARYLSRPLRELTAAIHSMARGNLRQQVPVRSKDELGELSMAFNQMSTDVEHATQLRKQMTADIAHELRTPLTVISGYLESLRDGILPPTQERLDTLYEESQHLARLVEDLRTLSLADAGELSLHPLAVAPGDLLERLAQVYHTPVAQQGVTLTVAAEADLPEIKVDPDRIEQVLSNLVSNALRYTPAEGQITISARREGSDRVSLVVQDTGAGIAADDLPRVFERFYRGDRSRRDEGSESGLGLAIARSIVELHGGEIRAESAGPGQGSTFTIHLPAASAKEQST